ncbi:MAG: HD domain-containing protein [Proteobacteria bacterium]|nr:HD domain-containing protein [Pseudomonadota bacterium]
MSFSDSGFEEFRRELEAIWNREPVFTTRTQFQDLQGKPLDLLLTVPIPPSLEEAGEVMVSMLDISKELLAEVETEKAYRLMSNAAVGTMNAISATIEKRDPYTAGHQQAVSQLAEEIAGFLGWGPFRIQGLRFAAAIHNIGNVYIPTEILNRPGRLSDPEKGIVRSHPEVGAEILANTELPWSVSSMILQHHERLDGSGYPHGLRGSEILEESLVIGVADMMLAMTSHRPFRAALSYEEALEELRQHGVGWYGETICTACETVCRQRWKVSGEAAGADQP